jgi:hypothetical protein
LAAASSVMARGVGGRLRRHGERALTSMRLWKDDREVVHHVAVPVAIARDLGRANGEDEGRERLVRRRVSAAS